MKKFALIVAGGTGSRMGSTLPKQFMRLGEESVLMHTIRVFHRFDSGMPVLVVLPVNEFSKWKELCSQCRFVIPHQVIAGGERRFFSVRNGLDAITEEGIIFIHDGVRPLVNMETLERCYNGAQEHSNAIPAVPVTESLRESTGDGSRAVDRTKYFHVQTPQTFRVSIIKEAYHQEYREQFTDDASVLENAGYNIHLVKGNYENIKITRPIDLIIAETLIRYSAMKS
jgi:2-C-methyl-D-erythritol 4-phosphate cytidylyltransferase